MREGAVVRGTTPQQQADDDVEVGRYGQEARQGTRPPARKRGVGGRHVGERGADQEMSGRKRHPSGVRVRKRGTPGINRSRRATHRRGMNPPGCRNGKPAEAGSHIRQMRARFSGLPVVSAGGFIPSHSRARQPDPCEPASAGFPWSQRGDLSPRAAGRTSPGCS